MKRIAFLALVFLAAAGVARADCYFFRAGVPAGGQCAETCSGQGPLPEGQCCYECQATPTCVVATVLPCPSGSGGGGSGGVCHGSGQGGIQPCTEDASVRPGDAARANGMRKPRPDPVVGFNHLESVCFYFKDGTTLNLKFKNPPPRGDALAIQAAVLETALQYRADSIALGKARGFEDQMVAAASLDQWGGGSGEGGLSCRWGYARSGMKFYVCSCDAAGTGCIRVIVQ